MRDSTHLRADELAGPAGDGPPGGPNPPGRAGAAPAVPSPVGPSLVRGGLAVLRNIWRQLTSMRVALILLFLLALASLPGALLPQWTLNQGKTARFIVAHPFWGPLLDRTGFFAVFSSPWYAAIYLLLFTSLVGCLLPRTWEFLGQLRHPPVATPRNLARLPHHASVPAIGDVDQVADRILRGLRGWRRLRRTETSGPGTGMINSSTGGSGVAAVAAGGASGPVATVTVSAEKGYLREIGNLVFHLSLLGLLVAVAVGKLLGFEGSVILTAGTSDSAVTGFCSSSPADYASFRPGLLVDGTGLTPFCVQVDSFAAKYNDGGQATSFLARISYQSGADLASGQWTDTPLAVNDPLRIGDQRLYLLGHGYSPTFTVTYPNGNTQRKTQPFQPQDSTFTSQGAVKFTDPAGFTGQDITAHQVAVVGIFAPTSFIHGGIMTSSFPAARAPGVAVDVYQGDLGMEGGAPQSVFAIDMDQVSKGKLVRKARANLTPHQSVALPDGTRVTFDGYAEWVSLQTSYDPAQGWALVFATSLLAGLMTSLTIKRRRVWFRIVGPGADPASGGEPVGPGVPDPAAGSAGSAGPSGSAGPAGPAVRVEVGGLARTDQAGYGGEFQSLVALARDGQG